MTLSKSNTSSSIGTLMRIFLICTALFLSLSSMAKDKFVVVIDAGHGGHDSGAKGRISREKNINLSIALLMGKEIEKKHKDVKVIYTRKKDVFLKLQERADIANKNKADLFISIHTNAARNRRAYGTETYVLGLHKTQSNLEVAMRENAVIMLEDDYQTRYQDFNPNSIDSYIMFNFMQDKYLDNSLSLATSIESEFKKNKRYSRGVRQAGFWVLNYSACPSVLVELGFISNRAEEQYLASKNGQKKMANALYKAFATYKKEYDNKAKQTTENINTTPKPKPKPTEISQQKENGKIIYKIQLFAVEKKIAKNHKAFKGLKNTSYYKEGIYYKYLYGAATSYKEIEKIRKKIAKKFPKAFVVAFKNQKKIPLGDALKKSKN